MTIATTTNSVQYTGNGVTTAFAVPFVFYDASDLIVTYTVIATGVDTVKTITTDYTVSGGSGSTGTVTALAAPASTIRITIERSIPYTQESDFIEGAAVLAETVEQSLDRGVVLSQQLKGTLDRTLSFPATLSGSFTGTLPQPEDGKTLMWDGTSGAVAIGPDGADLVAAGPNAAAAAASAAAAALDAASASSSAIAAQAAAAGINSAKVRAATTGVLAACTYANGAAGVGATLTGDANGAIAAQDGITLVAGNRLLVKDQASQLQNGIYTVTQVGTAGTPFILTRTTDADTWAEIVSKLVTMEEGSTLAEVSYICSSNDGGTVGTTAVVFTLWTSTPGDGSVTYAKIAAAALGSVADMFTGVASKLVNAANFFTFMDTYVPRLVHTQVPTVATTCVIGYQFRAGYDYEIEFSNIEVSTSNITLNFEYSTDNGSTFITAAASYKWHRSYGTTSYTGDNSASAATINGTAYGMLANSELNGTLKLFNPAGGSKQVACHFSYDMTESSGSAFAAGITKGRSTADLAVDKIRLVSSTNFKAQGTITVWERKCT